MKTLPDDLDETRGTPKFNTLQKTQIFKRKHSRSVEKININSKETLPASSPCIQDMTFSSKFFNNEEKRPKNISIQLKKGS